VILLIHPRISSISDWVAAEACDSSFHPINSSISDWVAAEACDSSFHPINSSSVIG
jgi:hypothetical protein